jgi:C1A family cysteine protease
MAEGMRLEEIQAAISSRGVSWQAGVTSLSELPREEQRKRLGVPLPAGLTNAEAKRQIEAARSSVFAASAASVGAPAAFDWRNVNGQNFITSVKDQSSCGSCVAFGVTSVVEASYRIQQNDPNATVDLSEAQLFYCHGRSVGRNCDNGWEPGAALEFFKNQGVADEASYPYTAGDQNCSNLAGDWQTRAVKVTGYHTMGSVADMKTWLSTRGPITGCFYVYDDFYSYKSGVYRHVSGDDPGGHCVTIIGYDDALQCWICKNSWGTGWGDQGFFKIGYGECLIETWLGPYAVDGVALPNWISNKQVVGLWTIDQDRNAWAFLEGVGWQRVAYDNDTIFYNMLSQLVSAKAAHRPVSVYQESSVIKQVYVF